MLPGVTVRGTDSHTLILVPGQHSASSLAIYGDPGWPMQGPAGCYALISFYRPGPGYALELATLWSLWYGNPSYTVVLMVWQPQLHCGPYGMATPATLWSLWYGYPSYTVVLMVWLPQLHCGPYGMATPATLWSLWYGYPSYTVVLMVWQPQLHCDPSGTATPATLWSLWYGNSSPGQGERWLIKRLVEKGG